MNMFLIKKMFKSFFKKFADVAISFSLMSGSVLAINISWATNSSLLLAILHGALGWLYVFYATGHIVLFAMFVSVTILALINAIKNAVSFYKTLNKMSLFSE